MKFEVKIDGEAELRALLVKIGAAAAQAVADATAAGAKIAVDEAVKRAPGPYIEARPGKFSTSRAEFEIGPDREHWYYQFFETGAGTHEIDGHVRKALAFTVGGTEVVVARAKHPGMAAEPFLRPALEDGKDAIQTAMGDVWKRAVERLAGGD